MSPAHPNCYRQENRNSLLPLARPFARPRPSKPTSKLRRHAAPRGCQVQCQTQDRLNTGLPCHASPAGRAMAAFGKQPRPGPLQYLGKADVAGLAHVVLQVLPRGGVGKSVHKHPKLRVCGWRGAIAAVSTAAASRRGWTTRVKATAAAETATATATALGKLDPEAGAVEVVSVTALDGGNRVARVLKLDEGKAWGARRQLQVDLRDAPILVEDVFQLAFADVLGQVANKDPAASHGCEPMGSPGVGWAADTMAGASK
mmetsp:Transcript_33374/g.86590  ORF Transcript_33374/g.86590 Transcript_33374/m.86590 type:complete len:258 (-) Transcript_33374:173-946(-)